MYVHLQVLKLFFFFPTGCTPCECNLAGSVNPVCNKTTGQCPCKEHSVGRQCDMCPSGYYGLSVNNSEGCLKCQCSNKSSNCTSDQGWFVSQITTNLTVYSSHPYFDNWTAINSAKELDLELDWGITIDIEK